LLMRDGEKPLKFMDNLRVSTIGVEELTATK
jgi:hypothetical protein